MADPVTLAAISIGSTVAGTAVSAIGSAQSASAKSSMYSYQAQIASYNQTVAKQNEDYALWSGEQNARTSGEKTAQSIGTAKAQQGASNLDVNFGSAKDVRESIAKAGWQDQSTIRSNAAIRAYGYATEAVTQSLQADMYSKAAKDSKTSGVLSVASSILGGATSVSDKWLNASTKGIFGSTTSDTGGAASP